jgi:hypothetical protein
MKGTDMSRLMIFIFAALFLAAGSLDASDRRNRKQDENERREQFSEMAERIEKGDFVFRARRAHPTGAPTVDLTGRNSIMAFENGRAEARLPFFGRARNIRYGQRGGINFRGDMYDVRLDKNHDRMRIRYSFTVRDFDTYRVSMDISHNGTASVTVISNNRSQISYHGEIVTARN